MGRREGAAFAHCLLLLLLAGCSDVWSYNGSSSLRTNDVLMTTADVRTLLRVPDPAGLPGPSRYVTCAEPSPDIARAVDLAIKTSGSAQVRSPEGTSTDVQAALDYARAESVAQLGRRIATIQLLRDGLYRACEAYANGAINALTYTAIVSKYDDAMITMLLGEIAGNAASTASIASISGTAGSGQGGGDALKTAVDQLGAQREAVKTADIALTAARTDGSGDENTRQTAITKAEGTLDAAKRAEAGAEATVRSLSGTAASGTATVTAGSGSPSTAAVEKLAEMQKAYLDNNNPDTLLLTCIEALGSPSTIPVYTSNQVVTPSGVQTVATAQREASQLWEVCRGLTNPKDMDFKQTITLLTQRAKVK